MSRYIITKTDGSVLKIVKGLRDLANYIDNGKSFIWFSRQLKKDDPLRLSKKMNSDQEKETDLIITKLNFE